MCKSVLYAILFFTLQQGCAHGWTPPTTANRQGCCPLDVSAPTSTEGSVHGAISLDIVQDLTRQALQYSDQPHLACRALERLGELCQQRNAYNFSARAVSSNHFVRHVPGILNDKITSQVFDQVEHLVEKRLISTNPDSVDGLPSFHLNLVSDCVPLVVDDDHANGRTLKNSLQTIRNLVMPQIESLLETVRTFYNDPKLEIGDVFLRKYGRIRQGISAHYDVFAKCTAVIALDDTARHGTNGLYTTCGDSDHASLRQFFPLQKGDAVVHAWNVLHGVNMEAGLERTSLIVWFVTNDDKVPSEKSWLQGSDAISQFVRAIAIESRKDQGTTCPVELYLNVAEQGNSFAMARLGSLCEAKALSTEDLSKSRSILDGFNQDLQGVVASDEVQDESINLAKRFWLEGALRGNPSAQMALADELMVESTSTLSKGNIVKDWTIPAVLFGLAAQQGAPEAMEALERVVQLAVSTSSIQSQNDFDQCAEVAIARAATASL